MKEIYKKGTKVMGWKNSGITACDPYFDKPFFGEVLFYNSYDNVYEIQLNDRVFPCDVNTDNVTLFIQEIYEKAVELNNEAQKCYNKYIKYKSDMRKLISSV